MKTGSGSIKGRLFFWSLLITSTVLIVMGISLYLEIRQAILQAVERTLHSKIQILKGLLHEEHGMVELELAEVVSGEYSIPRSGHYYKVLIDHEILSASPSLVDEDFTLDSGEIISFDETLQQKVYISRGPANEKIMAVRHDFMIFDKPAVVYAAQSLEEDVIVINNLRYMLFIAIALNIFVLAFAGLWISRRSLRPLDEFSSRIEKITHKNMSERIDPAFQVDEVRNVAKSFNSMLDRLQNAFETEERLVADASHEIKTPLSVIKAQCDVLLQKDRTKEEYIKALYKIRVTSDGMKRMIADMLSLTRLDSGALSPSGFKAVQLKDCIERAIKFTEYLSEEKGVKIKTDIPGGISLSGDQDALTELFLNIIENAVRYSAAGGQVEISHSTDNDTVSVEIRDSGKGIKDQDLQRIFDRFYRADTSRSSDGTGLGLSIAKAIAEAHGGKIRVKSILSQGSCFIVSLPASSPS